MKKTLIILLVICFTASVALVGISCKAEEAVVEEEAAVEEEAMEDEVAEEVEDEDTMVSDDGGVRTVEPREDALPGERVTSETLSVENFPGLDEIGVAPKKQYFIAFSNGEDASDWTRALRDDMEATAEKYSEQFGIKFEWASAGMDTTKQLQDVQSLIAKKPDILLMMPNEAEPCAVVADWCNEAGIPLITINNQINATAGEGMFIAEFNADFYLNGIWHGLALVEALEKKYGEPKGDIAEIQGLLGASPAELRGHAVRYIFDQYPDINIVISRPGNWNPKDAYAAAQDIFTVMPDGTLDAMIGSFDDAAIAAAGAAEALGRTDIENRYTGNDGSIAALQALLDGKILVSPETSPLYATLVFEYVIQYLNGKDIPAVITNNQRIFRVDTDEQKEALKDIIEQCNELGIIFAPTSMGYYDVFPAYNDTVKELYPEPYWELDREDETFFPKTWTESASTIR